MNEPQTPGVHASGHEALLVRIVGIGRFPLLTHTGTHEVRTQGHSNGNELREALRRRCTPGRLRPGLLWANNETVECKEVLKDSP